MDRYELDLTGNGWDTPGNDGMTGMDIDFDGCIDRGRDDFTTWLEIMGLNGTSNGLAMEFR